VFNLERYLERVRQGRSPVAAEEQLSAAARATERLELAIRTVSGVERGALSDEDIELLDGLIEVESGMIVLTRRGRLLANEVALRLAAIQSDAPRTLQQRGGGAFALFRG
jgi:coproporphyrinogen III oxidase-like Fe-S oxidoreductase